MLSSVLRSQRAVERIFLIGDPALAAEIADDGAHFAIPVVRDPREEVVLDLRVEPAVIEVEQRRVGDVSAGGDLLLEVADLVPLVEAAHPHVVRDEDRRRHQ